MRLAKSPRNFTLKSLRESEKNVGVVEALASRLKVIGRCEPSVVALSARLYTWYNALSRHALRTTTVSGVAVAVRAALRKATEPGDLLFRTLPSACCALAENGAVDVDRFVAFLNTALLELENATPSLRTDATTAVLSAFGASDPTTLQNWVQRDYAPYKDKLADHRLRVFIDRVASTDISSDRWIDGIAGHLTGQRPDNWNDDALHKFDFEIRAAARRLAMWFSLVGMRQAHSTDLRIIHVVRFDGDERVLLFRSDKPNPFLGRQLAAVRAALGDEPAAIEVLGQLLVEYADRTTNSVNAPEVTSL